MLHREDSFKEMEMASTSYIDENLDKDQKNTLPLVSRVLPRNYYPRIKDCNICHTHSVYPIGFIYMNTVFGISESNIYQIIALADISIIMRIYSFQLKS